MLAMNVFVVVVECDAFELHLNLLEERNAVVMDELLYICSMHQFSSVLVAIQQSTIVDLS